MRKVERHVMLTIIDKLWVEHLTAMDELREGVGLQAYAQKDPLVVYKTQGYDYFQQLLANIQHDVVHTIFRVQPAVAQQPVRTQVTDESDQAPAAPGEPDGEWRRAAEGAQGRCQRALPLWQRQEVQALPRGEGQERADLTRFRVVPHAHL